MEVIQSELDASPLPFLHLMEVLKHLPRTGWLRTIRRPLIVESVAAHSWRSSVLGAFAPAGVNSGRCMELGVYHDIAESVAGDIPTYAGVTKGDQEPTSNTSAEYQEWPMRGVFKRVIVGDESLTIPPIAAITGMRKVDSVEEFRVAWAPTWMSGSELGGARELVEEFKARLSVRHRKNGQGETDVTGESLPKRRRGRPRKRL